MTFVLITVTADGEAHEARFKTKRACENAYYLARYGETPEKYKAIETQIQKEQQALWDLMESLPRKATEEDLCRYSRGQKGYDRFYIKDGILHASDSYCSVGGASWHPSSGEWPDDVHGQTIVKQKHDVKYARWFEEAGKSRNSTGRTEAKAKQSKAKALKDQRK